MDEIKVGDHSLYLEKCDLYAVIEGERFEMLPDELGGISPCDIDVWDLGGNVRQHSATDVDLSSVRTAEGLLRQLVRLCELDGDHVDESRAEIDLYHAHRTRIASPAHAFNDNPWNCSRTPNPHVKREMRSFTACPQWS